MVQDLHQQRKDALMTESEIFEQLKASAKETDPIFNLEEAREFYKNNTTIDDVTGNGIVFFTNKKC